MLQLAPKKLSFDASRAAAGNMSHDEMLVVQSVDKEFSDTLLENLKQNHVQKPESVLKV